MKKGKKRLIFFLHPTEGLSVNWVILDSADMITESVTYGDLTQLPDTEDYEVFVFVPTENVLLTEAELPKLSRQRLLQALPFALEDQLIEDVSELHFALGEQVGNKYAVAVVSRQKLATWLTQFEALDIHPRAFIPTIFMLPFIAGHWQINCADNHCLARTGSTSGFACESMNVENMVAFKRAELLDPQSIEITNTTFSEQQLLEKIAPHIDEIKYINLLQDAFAPKIESSKVKKNWLWVAYLLAGLIAFAFLSNIISYFILQHQANKIEKEIAQIYKRNFPNASSIVAPRERMTEKLRNASGLASKNNFLGWLAAIAKSQAQVQGITFKNLDFREQHLSIEVIAATFDTLDAFKKQLTQQGFSVKQQNAATVGSQVKATLFIQAGKP